MITQELLPIRSMEISDWDKIDSGFVVSGQKDSLIPRENFFSNLITEYLFNTELNISDYTNKYGSFYFYSYAISEPNPYVHKPEGVFVLDQVDELVLELRVKLNGQKFAQVDKHLALRMIAQLILTSVPRYLFNRTDFDGKKFYEDILPILKPISSGTRIFQDEEFPL